MRHLLPHRHRVRLFRLDIRRHRKKKTPCPIVPTYITSLHRLIVVCLRPPSTPHMISLLKSPLPLSPLSLSPLLSSPITLSRFPILPLDNHRPTSHDPVKASAPPPDAPSTSVIRRLIVEWYLPSSKRSTMPLLASPNLLTMLHRQTPHLASPNRSTMLPRPSSNLSTTHLRASPNLSTTYLSSSNRSTMLPRPSSNLLTTHILETNVHGDRKSVVDIRF